MWFPKNREDLDLISNNIVEFDDNLEPNHPGFNDKIYRKRRLLIGKVAHNYKYGNKIPTIDYNENENNTWKTCLTQLLNLYKTHACESYNKSIDKLIEDKIFKLNKIPQLQNVSDYLEKNTGWVLRPVKGLLSTRDFLAGLAYKVFYSTQYIRHHSKPNYTPEPDIIHELIGHVPLLLNNDFSSFAQKLGQLSLGLDENKMEQLGRLYWYSIEFGLIKENNKNNRMKVYGAGILSSIGELKYCLSNEAKDKYIKFNSKYLAEKDYPITKYQDIYTYVNNFNEMIDDIKDFICKQK